MLERDKEARQSFIATFGLNPGETLIAYGYAPKVWGIMKTRHSYLAFCLNERPGIGYSCLGKVIKHMQQEWGIDPTLDNR